MAVRAAESGASGSGNLAVGKTVYEQHCAACHGQNGDGNGPATVWLFPKPRNFNTGLFKIKSTPGVALPTDDDLLETITRGMAGSSMPSFTYLTEAERRNVVQYVKALATYTNGEGKRVNHFEEAAKNDLLAQPVRFPPEPPVTLAALTQGKEVYVKFQCAACHGETGAGDGPNAPTLKDNWGFPALPRDFNSGAFRGGPTGRDLYLRIHNGMPGTPMPPFGKEAMTPEERWALVLYIQSLRQKDAEISDMLPPPDGHIHVQRVKKLPVDPLDAEWERWDPARVPVNPLWPEPNTIFALSVRAVHDGKRVAIQMQWRDPVRNGAPVRVQDFQDAVALQFSLNGSTPFLGMGDARNPVNIWMWRAGWQQELDGPRPDVNTRYVSIHVDTYFKTSYQTAQAAGNPLAQPRKSAVEDANARGFGTLTPQPASEQNVQGRGVWHDGFWNVLVYRDIKSSNEGDVKFQLNKPVPVAFAIWDGAQQDRNGRKEISNWYQLVLDP
ncbi:MAG: c-type cytochrome [Verrucomicrobiota bacterium]